MLIYDSRPSARHQPKLQDHGHGADVSHSCLFTSQLSPTGTNLYCLVTEAHWCEQRLQRVQNTLARVVAGRINFKLATLTHDTLNSSQPAHLHSLLSYHTPARSVCSSSANLLSVPRVHTTFASHGFSVAAPSVLFGTHSPLTFTLVLHHPHSIVFLKPTFSIRPSVPPSRSHKCLRFGLWSILRTIKILLTYLLTYLLPDSDLAGNQTHDRLS